eukprot:CAMPEP_0204383994 /NCGR_PEP_ID=MMETSP0469-20131031/56490_1 /ASSEMBLY_ACC=CAM_ASM_000384 /TAXON_ID=2969 /ORGANISM="Oxyrrhis marina" /LENGTH=44 /DNA_ID= /DNA_START= /DNA_END= /DNA_ORIENTATION=
MASALSSLPTSLMNKATLAQRPGETIAASLTCRSSVSTIHARRN